jgi:hypothetical protein
VATSFRPHPNNVSAALAANYTAGSGSLVLASGAGAAFGSTFPMTVTVAQAANVGLTTEVNTIFTVTGRTTDTLTGVSAAEGTTDRAYAIGDRVEPRWTGGLAAAIETAVNGVESSTGITSGRIDTARLGSGTAVITNWLRGDGAWAPLWTYTDKSSGGAVAANQNLCAVNAAGAVTLTLPGAASVMGCEFVFVRVDATSNVITIQRTGTDVINGSSTSVVIPAGVYKYIRLMSLGFTWAIVGSN